MKRDYHIFKLLQKQLTQQEVCFQIQSEEELKLTELKWRKTFVKKPNVPNINRFKWHVFSFNYAKHRSGLLAEIEYMQQYPADLVIFDESLSIGIKCINLEKIPSIAFKKDKVDLYISHHNMKWTYVIPHETPDFGPFFAKAALI